MLKVGFAVPADGNTAVLATERFAAPWTRDSGSTTAAASVPMRHVPTGW